MRSWYLGTYLIPTHNSITGKGFRGKILHPGVIIRVENFFYLFDTTSSEPLFVIKDENGDDIIVNNSGNRNKVIEARIMAQANKIGGMNNAMKKYTIPWDRERDILHGIKYGIETDQIFYHRNRGNRSASKEDDGKEALIKSINWRIDKINKLLEGENIE